MRPRADRPDEVVDEVDGGGTTRSVWPAFAVVGGIVTVGGGALATAAENIVDATRLTAGFVGAVPLGLVNALP